MEISRREFVWAGTVAGFLGAVELAGCGKARVGMYGLAPDVTLRGAGDGCGVLTGCAVQPYLLKTQPEYAALVVKQAGILVAENSMKFGPMRPSPTTFDFREADELVAFAGKNGQKVRGHNFVWHRAIPEWFAGYMTPENAEQMLVEHIERVGGRYAGRLHSWDVVNEAIDVADNLPGGIRDTPWRKLLGDKYIDIAFRTARKADPHAMLVYNDYGIERDDPYSAKKRVAVLELLRGMQQRGVPVDALGIQSHISAKATFEYGAGLRGLIADAKSMGLQVLLTEMDVNDRAIGPDVAERDAAVAEAYAAYLKIALESDAVVALLTWGITDKYTWLNGEDSRKDGLKERPLPFDAELKPKPAFYAEAKALMMARRV